MTINVTKSVLPSLQDYSKLLEQIWDSNQIANNGPLVRQLQRELIAHLGIAQLELVANGTLALQLAIRALNLKGEIITTPFSYVATANAIAWEGCIPVFADIDQTDLCLDPDLVEAAINERTVAILATHVYGYPCAVERFARLAEKYSIPLIYDAAHAFDVKIGGQSLLSFGDAAALSFHATKLFHTAEGGAVVCRDAALTQRVSLMKKFGHIGEENYFDIGVNAKLSELHAAIGLALLPQIPDLIKQRQARTEWYDDLIADLPLRRPFPTIEFDYNYAYYPVIFASHAAMMRARAALLQNDIVPRRYFHPSLNTLPHLQIEGYRACPISESIAARLLCLPLYHDLAHSDVRRVVGIIQEAMR
jgi:dTDP-4-amino-4,6-dideoxygalactose transaminase